MNLAVTISLLAGGPGSGCNPAVGKCGRSASARDFVKSSLRKGWSIKDREALLKEADKIKLDSRLLQGKLSVIPLSLKEAQDRGQKAFFDRSSNPNNELHVYPKFTDTFVHEFGHWLDKNYVDLSNKGTPSVSRLGIDKKALVLAKNAAHDEYVRAHDSAYRTKGYFKNVDDQMSQAPHGVSFYALHNEREWFAESFAHYVAGGSQRSYLRDVAPKTYALMNDLANGLK